MANIDIEIVLVALATVVVAILFAWIFLPRAKKRSLPIAAFDFFIIVVAGKIARLLTANMDSGGFLQSLAFIFVVIVIAWPLIWVASKFARRAQ